MSSHTLGSAHPTVHAPAQADGDVRLYTPGRATGSAADLDPAVGHQRVVIEAVSPSVDEGRFAAKRTVGDRVTVEADVFADGHDRLQAVVRYRGMSTREARELADPPWIETPMTHADNDRWRADFPVTRPGIYEFTVEAWVDRFGSWQRELSLKFGAGQDVDSELLEGAQLVREVADTLEHLDESVRQLLEVPDIQRVRHELLDMAHTLELGGDQSHRVAVGLSRDLADAIHRWAPRKGAVTVRPPFRLRVDRERARFGAWYEMFPRSYGPDPGRSATFREAAERLPALADMGFDVVYLPPIHPIGRSHRKGPNNTLVARPGDPGSPWAIGGPEGGHKAVEPGLGTVQDFEYFRARAEQLGMEIALDLALQCSPDHPYVREHPEWFRHRPDGTIKYAENPPKKYQDIYPIDFETEHWPALWDELKSIVLFWLGHGVRIYRVDNPHTKPFKFWEWVIGDVHAVDDSVIFLSEAFTRPKVMKRLAKLGFTQSYTYFTWRNTGAELTEYFTELTQGDGREYMRPNLFTNTPDILHAYLQKGGPPAFEVRFILAATLGASYGIYSGFELCENVPVREGSEEYLESEKYQIKVRDWDAPGNLSGLIRRVNEIRRRYPALQRDGGLHFHATDNDQLLCYSKTPPDGGSPLLIVVNLDPAHMQHGWVQVPADRWLPGEDGAFDVEDLLTGERYRWPQEWNYVQLTPGVRAAHVLRPVVP